MAYRHLGARVAQSSLRQLRSPLIQSSLHGRFASTEPPKLVGPMDNAFNRERLAVKQHAAQSADLWRKLCIYVVVPAILLASLNAKNLWDEHWEHWEHMPPLEERVEYPYMNIRTKAFPWGDGDKLESESQLSPQGLGHLLESMAKGYIKFYAGKARRWARDNYDGANRAHPHTEEYGFLVPYAE